MPCYILLTSLALAATSSAHGTECPRIRRAWHTLSTDERDLYISGLIELRRRGNGDPAADDFIGIASVHSDEFAPVTHKASSYLFWHGYLLWELEQRIRNLGGRYACFAMPYWDFTIEAGREEDPFIFETGLGGNGDSDDAWTVNEYSWPFTSSEFWVPYNCVAASDEYPICSLKRALKEDFTMATAAQIGHGITSNKEFTSFAKWYATQYNPVHLFTNAELFKSPNPVATSYDPIWYLFHSFVQYHQAIWTDCNDYDRIAADDLDQHEEAYTAYCVHGECTHPNKFKAEWMGMRLDDAMHFGGSLGDRAWSYINGTELTVRQLYDVSRWGIVYDLGDGQGFYSKSGLEAYCAGKLNETWFMLDEMSQMSDDIPMPLVAHQWLLASVVVSGMMMVVACFRRSTQKVVLNTDEQWTALLQREV